MAGHRLRPEGWLLHDPHGYPALSATNKCLHPSRQKRARPLWLGASRNGRRRWGGVDLSGRAETRHLVSVSWACPTALAASRTHDSPRSRRSHARQSRLRLSDQRLQRRQICPAATCLGGWQHRLHWGPQKRSRQSAALVGLDRPCGQRVSKGPLKCRRRGYGLASNQARR